MTSPRGNRAAAWFRRAVWLGIVVNLVLSVPVIFAPEAVLDLLGLRPTGDPVWTAFAALLLVLLSVFYIPGAANPHRNRFTAWMVVWARLAGVIFFLVLRPGIYPLFGYLDGVFFLIQLPLLVAALRGPAPAEG